LFFLFFLLLGQFLLTFCRFVVGSRHCTVLYALRVDYLLPDVTRNLPLVYQHRGGAGPLPTI
jgi:hypothetical protein